jgi:hypothetical protein
MFVSLHRHSIDPGAGRAPLPPKRARKRGFVDMVQQRRKPGMARSSRRHMDPFESGWQRCPALCPVSRLLARVILRSRPSLQHARCLRRHQRYYASIRHPAFSFMALVIPRHQRPPVTIQRQKQGFLGSNAIHTCMMWPSTPAERLRLATVGAARVAFDGRHGLGLCDLIDYVAQSHTLQAHCVRFGRAVTGRTRNTRYRAARYALPERDLPPQDRADFAQRTPASNRNWWASRDGDYSPPPSQIRTCGFPASGSSRSSSRGER